ncbi:MAG: hypothetical protein ACOX6T_06100 [Myxococcales bacterium]|jgi:glutamine synthetase
MFQDAEELLRHIRDRRISMVDFKLCNLSGGWHHLTLPAARVDEKMLERCETFDGASHLRSEAARILEQIGIPVRYHHHEAGEPGQCEIEPMTGCPRDLGTRFKSEEILLHHEVTNQHLWAQF